MVGSGLIVHVLACRPVTLQFLVFFCVIKFRPYSSFRLGVTQLMGMRVCVLISLSVQSSNALMACRTCCCMLPSSPSSLIFLNACLLVSSTIFFGFFVQL